MTTATSTESRPDTEPRAQGCNRHAGHGPHGCRPRFGGPWADVFGWRRVPVDIEEADDAFLLSLYAAGLDRTAFSVAVQDDVLTIRAEAQRADDETRRYTRRERTSTGFVREFALNGKVQVDAVTASYTDGVLRVRLPKTPSAMTPAHNVPVQ